MNLITLPQAVLVSLPTSLDLKHAAITYSVWAGCAMGLALVWLGVVWIADKWDAHRREQREYVIRRLIEGDRRRL